MDSHIFQLNIPAELSVAGSIKLYVHVETFKSETGRIIIDFLNLTTNLVCIVTDWQAVFSLALERSRAHWSRGQGEKPSDDLFLTLGSALNPVLNRQNIDTCKS